MFQKSPAKIISVLWNLRLVQKASINGRLMILFQSISAGMEQASYTGQTFRGRDVRHEVSFKCGGISYAASTGRDSRRL